MTRRRKWVLRVGLVGVVAVVSVGTWVGLNFTELKTSYAARQFTRAASDEERAKHADQLLALGDPGTKRLLDFCRTGDEAGRIAAVQAFNRLLALLPDGEPRAVLLSGQLLDRFADCPPDSQRAILEVLPVVLKKTGNTHAQKCRAAVAVALKMPEPSVRVLATRLAIHPDVQMRGDLIPLLGSPEAEVRRAALFAVASAEGEPLLNDEELFRFLHDPDEGVRQACHDALVSRDRTETHIGLGRRLSDPNALERLKLLLDLRYDDDVSDPEPWLERMSRDADPAVRVGATRVAIELMSERQSTCPPWVARVVDADPDGTVRRVAAFFSRQAKESGAKVDPNIRGAGAP